ncbi:MAG: hypothetical protein N2C14_14575 [Planctomycetales bacterium]
MMIDSVPASDQGRWFLAALPRDSAAHPTTTTPIVTGAPPVNRSHQPRESLIPSKFAKKTPRKPVRPPRSSCIRNVV